MASYTSTPYADTFALAKALAASSLDTPVVVTIQSEVLPEDGERVQFMCAVADIQIRLSGVPPDYEPDPPVPEPTKVLFAKVDDANIRYEPTTDAPSAAKLRAGTPVTVVSNRIIDGINGNTLKWYKVTEPTPGYMATVALAETAPPAPTEQLWATDDVNIRLTPEIRKDNFAGVMLKGQAFLFRKGTRTEANGYRWAERADNQVGFVADKWLTNTAPLPAPQPPGLPAPPPPTNPLPHPSCVIGLHISPNVDGGPGVVLEHLDRRARAGRPAAGVLLMDPGYGVQVEIDDIRRVSPETEIVSRRSAGDYERDWTNATAQEGRDFLDDHYTRWIASKPSVLDADFHQLFNEPKPLPTLAALNGFNLWMHGVLDRAGELRIKIALPLFSTGFGRLREFGDVSPFYWELGSTHEILDRVIREKHRFALHAYRNKDKPDNRWDDPWELFRHEAIYRVLPVDRRPDLAILEFGDERLRHKSDTFESNIVYTIQRMQQSPKVRYAALWGVGETSDQWREDRIEVLIPKLTEICLR
jgi:hypothetical protein